MPKLKVFRTAIGFHDAYVAVPSQKAALQAWGADGNLFAQDAAELVTDLALTEEPLANPGKVVKRLRGSAEDHLGALAKDEPAKGEPAKASAKTASAGTSKPAKPRPRPSRAALDKAEAALADEAARYDRAREALEAERHALDDKLAALKSAHRDDAARLKREVETVRARHDDALAKWRGS